MRCVGWRREARVSYRDVKRLVDAGAIWTGAEIAAQVLRSRVMMPAGDESLAKLIESAIEGDRSLVADALQVDAERAAADLVHDYPARQVESSVIDPSGPRPRLRVGGEVEMLAVLSWIIRNRSDLIGVVLKLSVEAARREMVACEATPTPPATG